MELNCMVEQEQTLAVVVVRQLGVHLDEGLATSTPLLRIGRRQPESIPVLLQQFLEPDGDLQHCADHLVVLVGRVAHAAEGVRQWCRQVADFGRLPSEARE